MIWERSVWVSPPIEAVCDPRIKLENGRGREWDRKGISEAYDRLNSFMYRVAQCGS